jgi:hypothetical protein
MLDAVEHSGTGHESCDLIDEEQVENRHEREKTTIYANHGHICNKCTQIVYYMRFQRIHSIQEAIMYSLPTHKAHSAVNIHAMLNANMSAGHCYSAECHHGPAICIGGSSSPRIRSSPGGLDVISDAVRLGTLTLFHLSAMFRGRCVCSCRPQLCCLLGPSRHRFL